MTIKGKLVEKKLVLENICANQGEAGSIELKISLEPLANTRYYLEFLCPYGRKYLSKEVEVAEGQINYLLPTCIFLVAGKVYVQLIGRADNAVIMKSTKSSDAAIEILPSINGLDHVDAEHHDFVSYAEKTIANASEIVENMQQKAVLAQQKIEAMNSLVRTIEQKLQSGELDGKSAYLFAIEKGYCGTEQEFSEKLSILGEIIEDVSDRELYARSKNQWVQTAKVPLPNTQSIGKVLAVTENEQEAEYSLMPLLDTFVDLDIDAEELENFARRTPYVFRCKKIITQDETLNGLESIFEISYVFRGQIIIQNILDKAKALTYSRQKITNGKYGKANIEPAKPLSLENFLVEPNKFVKSGYFYKASINLEEYFGHEIGSNVIPMFVLAKTSQMTAYNCNLDRDIELVDGVLNLKAGCPPSSTLQGNLILIGVYN